ncbi:MAG: acyl-[acyl-carrier-protein]--UDP-N-acetylglucosamine O-acyltransferase [Omnitrophica bacterium RIFCSPHIGHO2_02_FULL_49_9]|nr:MAG: acyl-[acyl-carrier-protein]--UDP-N-acetylglucosamine O-acyltransferase [Omnitrophica bacterium RIFCSPHIGHO2_02_FULL_49_9]OGW88221.1 MAG: acyl-[acyl-carrier-protein]--UDP-N-acetylglucosamine O-acyltransferase [Omnitrophica bacterium RIFCSPLOWO2_01_FULL_50_24]
MTVEIHKTNIHPTAIVHPDAELGAGVTIGPYSVIEEHAVIGDGTKVGSRVTIEGHTTIGKNNEIFTGAIVGSVTQDKKFDGGISLLKIGDGNKIREYSTINPGTSEGTETIIGDDNLIMAYAHIAHDCVIGNRTVIANAGTLGGHVVVEDQAIVGGLCGIHQFVRIGQLAIVGGNSKVVQDVPPFLMADGHPARAYGLNSVGLERANVPFEERQALKRAFKILFRSGLSTRTALSEIRSKLSSSPSVSALVTFVEKSDRGICK